LINQDGDLDQQLTKLFAAPGLAVQPRGDATAMIVTLARRRRRRRAALQMAGSIVAVCLLSVGVLQARSLGRPAPPANSLGRPAPRATSIEAPLRGELAMSGSSVGPLRLGMTRAQAEATGLLITPPTGSGCLSYSGKNGIVAVQIGRAGVSSIEVYTFIRTAQGVGIGDNYAKLQATYPSVLPESPDSRTSYRVPVPGQSGAWYVFDLELTIPDGRTSPLPSTRQTRVAALTLRGAAC
jgi:hypothetical protein